MLSYPSDEAIKISSIHRAKGLENDRVFILEYNKLPYKRDLDWENIQERNLHYVAVTRPKEELYLCEEQILTDGDEDAIDNVQPAQPINEANEMNIEQPNSIIPTEASNLIIPVGRTEKVIKDNISEEQESLNNLISPIKVVSQSDNTEEQEKEYALLEPKTLKKTRLNFFIKLNPTQKISKIPNQFYSLEEIEDTPYPGLMIKYFKKRSSGQYIIICKILNLRLAT